ncbi:MAG TPA: DnaJ domain-containing protein [Candidatus Acidoferrum sp.]|nr:DnaJ domain-containing protein [Candidatus Acidoferrum sp.]
MIPQEIPDFGSSLLAPRQNPEFTPGVGFTTEDYFVWSRLDGRTSLREVILMVGLGVEKSIGILRKLRRSGAVLLQGEDPAQMAAALALAMVAAGAGRGEPDGPARELPALGALTRDEGRTMAEAVALEEGEKTRIIQMMRLVAGSDYFALLGVGRNADKREIKRAYYRLSKEFHPDRHYKQNLGTFGPLLNVLFETATVAFEVLSDDEKRAEYQASLAGGGAPAQGSGVPSAVAGGESSGPVAGRRAPASPAERAKAQHGTDLFSRGCEREVAGDIGGALRMFRAAIQVDAQPRYLRRAAKCALVFGQIKEAEGYAEKAVSLRADDASYARLMSDVLRAAGRLEEAEETLLRALELPSTSDALAMELQGDLSEVRAARAARAQG